MFRNSLWHVLCSPRHLWTALLDKVGDEVMVHLLTSTQCFAKTNEFNIFFILCLFSSVVTITKKLQLDVLCVALFLSLCRLVFVSLKKNRTSQMYYQICGPEVALELTKRGTRLWSGSSSSRQSNELKNHPQSSSNTSSLSKQWILRERIYYQKRNANSCGLPLRSNKISTGVCGYRYYL